MTPPGHPTVRRRRWLIGLVAVWIAVVAVLAVWSVDHEPATVPEQRDIARAVPDLQRAAGVVFAAAAGPGRAVVLGDLVFTEDCRVTPLRPGLVATRDVTVHVGAGRALTALEDIAAALPPEYAADVAKTRGGTRVALLADAGNFIAVDANAEAEAQVLEVRLSTGCRPKGDALNRADPAAGPAPALLGRVLTALSGGTARGAVPPSGGPGAAPSSGGPGPAGSSASPGPAASNDGSAQDGKPRVRAIGCPAGGVAATYAVDGVPQPADLAASLSAATAGAEVVRADAAARAYRVGGESVVVVPDGKRLRVSVSTAC